MTPYNLQQLQNGKCTPCEGGVTPISPGDAEEQLKILPNWELDSTAMTIERKWKFKNFREALNFCNRAGEIAEAEQHHPDIHLIGYRNVRIVLTTHAIKGLSENDFLIAAKLDAVETSKLP